MKSYASIISLCFLASCAVTPKQAKLERHYKPFDHNGGYTEANSNDGLVVARFTGNSKLADNVVKLYSELRAIEICNEKGFQAAVVHGTRDLRGTEYVANKILFNPSKPIYNSNAPAAAAVVAPVPQQMQPGQPSIQVNPLASLLTGRLPAATTPSPLKSASDANGIQNTYPVIVQTAFDTYFKCANNHFETWLTMRELDEQTMTPYLKDFLGAVQVMDIQRSTVNDGGLLVGDIVLRIDNRRVLDLPEFEKLLALHPEKKNMQFEVVRDGVKKMVTVQSLDQIDEIKRQNKRVLDLACSIAEISDRSICSAPKTTNKKTAGLN